MSWLKEALKYEDRHEVRHKGRLKFVGTLDDCKKWFHNEIENIIHIPPKMQLSLRVGQ